MTTGLKTGDHEATLVDELISHLPGPPRSASDWDAVQSLYMSICSRERRRKLGQFFTPIHIAEMMADWILACDPHSVLDPSVGLGIFPWTLLRRRKDLRITAIDIDPAMVAAANRLVPGLNARIGNFLLCPGQECGHAHGGTDLLAGGILDKYDAIICNPPYIRHHEARLPEEVYAHYADVVGATISRLTNIYGLFLIEITRHIKTGGRAAVITPAEYLNANFGIPIKRYLVENGFLSELILFDHAIEVFGGALTTAAIALIEVPEHTGRRNLRLHRIIRSTDRHLSDDASVEYVLPPETIDPQAKWQTLGIITRRAKGAVLGDYARCMRGIATGANDYFTLSRSEAEAFGLPDECLIPCITRSCHVPGTKFGQEDLERLIASDKKVFLVNLMVDHPSVSKYRALGQALGVHRRYLPSHRKPWYALEKRQPAPIWVTVFGRGRFRFIRNLTDALCLTTFHCIYPDGVSADDLAEYLQSEHCRQAIQVEMRVYGGGLEKLEPRDVLRIPIDWILKRNL